MKTDTERCGATLGLADDFGDNPATFSCGRDKGHEGDHQEAFDTSEQHVLVSWCNAAMEAEND